MNCLNTNFEAVKKELEKCIEQIDLHFTGSLCTCIWLQKLTYLQCKYVTVFDCPTSHIRYFPVYTL